MSTDDPNPESWQAKYRIYGHQYVEPLEYLPIPGSTALRNIQWKSQGEPVKEDEPVCL